MLPAIFINNIIINNINIIMRERLKKEGVSEGRREEGEGVKWRSESGLPRSFLTDNNQDYSYDYDVVGWLYVVLILTLYS